MKAFTVIFLLSVVLLNYSKGVKYDEEDVYDDYEVNVRSYPSEDYETPQQYNIQDAPDLFLKFVQEYNKQYKTEDDYRKHYDNFVKNLEEINANNKAGKGSVSKINMFSDYGDDELAKLSG